jgi:DNA-binding NarL/FixJ family response regulator
VRRARVFLADDNEEILQRVAQVLASEFDVVGTVLDGQALLDAVARLEPDVVVLDIAMPVLKGLEAAEGLHQSGSSTKIVFLTVNTNREVVRAALETGAMGYVVKAHLSKDLVLAIKAALAGVGYVSPSVLESKE